MYRTRIEVARIPYRDGIIPQKASADAAGHDLYACLEEDYIYIQPHTTYMVQTGIAIAIPEGCFGGIFARSGLASRQGLRPANCVGVIDSDYRGEIMVALHNDTDMPQKIEHHERIAQLIVIPYLPFDFVEAKHLGETERGAGGFGSTGKNVIVNDSEIDGQLSMFD